MGTNRTTKTQNVQFKIQCQSRHRKQVRIARRLWGPISRIALENLRELVKRYDLSVSVWRPHLFAVWLVCDARWSAAIGSAEPLHWHRRCSSCRIFQSCSVPVGIQGHRLQVPKCRGFVGYGDADPSNVSPLVHGAEMRVAETRAVNRALRKAYGIGICSVEEIGSFAEPVPSSRESKKLPPQPVNGKNGNYGGPKVRDRLCQLIRQHQLDANLVKSYAVDFCGTKTLREASREQVEAFVAHLADWAEKDRNALLCQLNSYPGSKEGAA